MGPFSSLTYPISQLMSKYFLSFEVSSIEKKISRLGCVGMQGITAGAASSAQGVPSPVEGSKRETHTKG